jgi:hypothetical protein
MTAAFDARRRSEQRFTDALCGPDGTGDPSVLMPVLPVYPDALSAPMPDAMVAATPIDVAAALAAVRPPAPPQPVQPQPRPGAAGRVAQPGRYGRNQTPARAADRSSRSTPPAWGTLEPRSTVAPHLQGPRRPHDPPAPASTGPRSGRAMSPGEVAGFLRNTFTGMTQGVPAIPQRHEPVAHAPTPPLPRNPTRRNRGSGVWAVFIFLVVIAFASGLGQQIIRAISELFSP